MMYYKAKTWYNHVKQVFEGSDQRNEWRPINTVKGIYVGKMG